MKNNLEISNEAYDRAYKNRIWAAEKQLTVIRGFSILIGFILWAVDYFYLTRQFSITVKVTLAFLSVASLQSVLSYYVVIIRNKYTPSVKYFNQILDIITVTGLIYVYKLGNYNDYAKVYMSARNYLYYIVIVFAAIRIDPKLVVGSGFLSMILYSVFIIQGNQVNGLVFSSSVMGQRALYLLDVSITEIILRVVFLGMFTAVTLFQVLNQLRFLREAVSTELESQELKRANELIERVNYENKKYLDNLDEGLLIIDQDLHAGKLYSESAREIFGTPDIEGRPVSLLFYPDGDEKKTAELDSFLNLLLKNRYSDMAMFNDINPLGSARVRLPSKRDPSGYEEKYLSASFKQIRDAGGEPNIIVLVSDITEKVELQERVDRDAEHHEQDIEIISRLLENDPAELADFIGEAEDTLSGIIRAVKTNDFSGQPEASGQILRSLHSLKGLSGTFGFLFVSSGIHEAETAWQRYTGMNSQPGDEDPASKNNPDLFIEKLTLVLGQFSRIRDLQSRLAGFLEKAKQKNLEDQDPANRFQSFLEKTVNQTSKLLGKKIRLHFTFRIESPESIPFLGEIKPSLVHLVNNSLDHGIENPSERKLHHKDETGTVSVSLYTEGNNVIVTVADDGTGIDTETLRKKIIPENRSGDDTLQSIPENSLYEYLFKSGYSSKNQVSLVSGRGVGLSAVSDLLKKYHGEMKIRNDPGKGASFSMIFPLHGKDEISGTQKDLEI